jgi:hypothetical protein
VPKSYYHALVRDQATAVSLAADLSELAVGLEESRAIEIFRINLTASDKKYFVPIRKIGENKHTESIIRVKLFRNFVLSITA